jgi:hypothetical protein
LAYKVPTGRGNKTDPVTITQTGGIATLTLTSGAHTIGVGQTIDLQGANEAGYQGAFTVLTAPNNTTLTFAVNPATASPATTNSTIWVTEALTGMTGFQIENDTTTTNVGASGTITLTGTPGATVPNSTQFTRAGSEFFYKLVGFSTKNPLILDNAGNATVTVDSHGGPNGSGGGGPDANCPTPCTLAWSNGTVVVQTPGITGGKYFLESNLVSYYRWFSYLKGYTLNLAGTTAAQDRANNSTIFQKPQ